MTEYAVEAENIKLYYGKRQVLDVEQFRLRYNEVTALIGPNGAGKSTLLQVLALLQRPASGKLCILGEEVAPGKELALRRRMAVVFQEPLLLDTTVFNNVAAGLSLRGCKKSEIKARVWKWLELFGIESLARRPARLLSGGESQRVSLARAFVLEPEVLFLDEPFSYLDHPTRRALTADLGDILQATRISTVMVTHDYNDLPLLADKVAVMLEGKIVQCCTPEELFANPADPAVAALLGMDNGRRKPAATFS
ncbi:ABC-type cobalt transport system, ATPase component [Pelotomaculum thermopropionicum SI]|uniref:ABC-type cobalt transport system, ATPase component n=1 Tax=Pelotomaculum thermopropionicum (strain DSM 13744 / JCM 10971 / SI) TaxID=370438 RepID=A5D549_PELTS|nr:ABC-type cobalt transport system, ATPase component [Pelotomaculum thermopropionicum SI]